MPGTKVLSPEAVCSRKPEAVDVATEASPSVVRTAGAQLGPSVSGVPNAVEGSSVRLSARVPDPVVCAEVQAASRPHSSTGGGQPRPRGPEKEAPPNFTFGAGQRSESTVLPSTLRSTRSASARATSSTGYVVPTGGSTTPDSSIGRSASHCSRMNPGRTIA